MKKIFALLTVFALLLMMSSAFAENVPVVVWGGTPATQEEAPAVVWGEAPAVEEEAPAAEEEAPAAEGEAPATEEDGIQTYSWDEYQSYAQLMGAEGHFYEYPRFSLQMFVPGALTQMEVSEEDAAQGILDIFAGEEHSLQIVTQYAFIGEGLETVEDLGNALNPDDYDAASIARINPYDALQVVRDGGQTLIVAISAGGGNFFEVTYHNMADEEWNSNMAVLSMASIQPMDEA